MLSHSFFNLFYTIGIKEDKKRKKRKHHTRDRCEIVKKRDDKIELTKTHEYNF
jgi:hypothetical protein